MHAQEKLLETSMTSYTIRPVSVLHGRTAAEQWQCPAATTFGLQSCHMVHGALLELRIETGNEHVRLCDVHNALDNLYIHVHAGYTVSKEDCK